MGSAWEQKKIRLDQELVRRGLAKSREQAQRLILAGKILVNGKSITKPATSVWHDAEIVLVASERYVSRGGYKLEHALRSWQIPVKGCRCIDVGSSTGGFTDCLLQHGAAEVVAVDVGKGQLAWKLRCDSRVKVMEGVNARFLRPEMFPSLFDGAVIDCSFISLRLILPVVSGLVVPGGWIIALFKPQFEVGRAIASRFKGVIRDPSIQKEAITKFKEFVERTTDLDWKDCIQSPILGPAGNREFLVWLTKQRINNTTPNGQ